MHPLLLLLRYLEHNLLHLLVGALELTYEDDHHFSCVVVGRLVVHQRDEVTNRLEERSQTLATMVPEGGGGHDRQRMEISRNM